MKLFTAAVLLLVGSSAAFATKQLWLPDPGWMAYLVGYSCGLDRKIVSLSDDELELAIAFSRKPHDDGLPAQGKIELSILLFRKGMPQFDPGAVFTIIAGQKKWKPTPSNGQDYILLGEQADAVRASFLAEPVRVQVVESNGNSHTFGVGQERFKVANATFNACVTELLLDKPSQPNTR